MTLLTQKSIHSGAITAVKVVGNCLITGGKAILLFSSAVYCFVGLDGVIFCHEIIPSVVDSAKAGSKKNKNTQSIQYHFLFKWLIRHESKINCIDGSLLNGEFRIYVSDTTSQLSNYTVFLH
jgi:hypothetical protein